MSTRVVKATEFKAKCLALLDEVSTNGGTITVTKRGRPMATVGPVRPKKWVTTAGLWKGKVELSDECLMADRSDLWEVVQKK